MIKEYSKSNLSTPSLAQSYKSQNNKERQTKSRSIFNSIYKIKEKKQQKDLSELENQQKQVRVEHLQANNNKMDKMVNIFKFWKTFFIGILIIQFMTELGQILLQYLDHTMHLDIFLLLTTVIIVLMLALFLLAMKLRFPWLRISKKGEKAIEELKNQQFGGGRQIFNLISQNHCPTPIVLVKQLQNMNAQQKQDVENHIPKNTISKSALRIHRMMIILLTIVKIIQIFAYFSINTLSLTLLIPQQLNQKQTILFIGIFSYSVQFSSLIVSAFFFKRSVELLHETSKDEETQQIFKEKINYYPVIENKLQNLHQKIPKFASINNENFDETLKSVKLIRIQSELTSQNCQKLQNNESAIKICAIAKKSALKQLISSKGSSKPSTNCTERRKVQINSKKIQYFQYSDTQSNKKSEKPIKINQISVKDVRLQNIRQKVKSKSKSLQKYHPLARKTTRFITTHKSTTTLETKANLWKSKRWQ